MSRILFSLSMIAMIAACEAPADKPTDKPAGAAESATPTTAEKAPEANTAKVAEKSASATTAIAAKDGRVCGGAVLVCSWPPPRRTRVSSSTHWSCSGA